ncbi:MAG: hypothetical protein HUK22_06170, partial [Thermoguttaceae bacterium]|nr:hypothetical protein [Thermoguttaceae bacterium]
GLTYFKAVPKFGSFISPVSWLVLGGVWVYWLLVSPVALFARKIAIRLAATGSLAPRDDERPFFSRDCLGRGMIFQAAQSLISLSSPFLAVAFIYGLLALTKRFVEMRFVPDNRFINAFAPALFILLAACVWGVAVSSRMVSATFFLTENWTPARAWRWARSHMKGLSGFVGFCEFTFRLGVAASGMVAWSIGRGAGVEALIVNAGVLALLYALLLALRTAAYIDATGRAIYWKRKK